MDIAASAPVRRLIVVSWVVEAIAAIGIPVVTARLAYGVQETGVSVGDVWGSGVFLGIVVGVLLALAACRVQCDGSSITLVNIVFVVTLPWGVVQSIRSDNAFEVLDTAGNSYGSQIFVGLLIGDAIRVTVRLGLTGPPRGSRTGDRATILLAALQTRRRLAQPGSVLVSWAT